MRKVIVFMLATALIFGLVVSTPDLAVAQGKVNMKGGPLKEDDWLTNPGEAALNEDHAKVKTWISLWYGPD